MRDLALLLGVSLYLLPTWWDTCYGSSFVTVANLAYLAAIPDRYGSRTGEASRYVAFGPD